MINLYVQFNRELASTLATIYKIRADKKKLFNIKEEKNEEYFFNEKHKSLKACINYMLKYSSCIFYYNFD